jgi:hydrogenase expression/formation protein HypC
MCLGIPGKVLDVRQEDGVLMGTVQFGGITKQACLEHVPEVRPGDYVVVHVGFALSRVDEAEARRIFDLLAEMKALEELEAPDREVP